MEYSYSAKEIANYFLELSAKKDISPLKIQKLVYIAHGWHLALYGEPLVQDELAEAWEYGPVFPSIYHEFKRFGAGPILEPVLAWTYYDFLEEWDSHIPRIKPDDKRTIAFLNRIWELYGHFSAGELSAMTHEEGSPWNQVREEVGPIKNANIDNALIEKYYKDRLL